MGGTPGGGELAADAGPSLAGFPADVPAAPGCGADDRIARLGGETLDGGIDTAIGTPGQDQGPEAEQAREELREWVARFCPQLHHRLSEWLGSGYSPELIRYAVQQALDCNKTASIRWIRGILENKTREGWTPPPAAIAAPAADAPGTAMPRQGAIAAPLSRNAARQRDALERWRRFRADQQPDAPEETAP